MIYKFKSWWDIIITIILIWLRVVRYVKHVKNLAFWMTKPFINSQSQFINLSTKTRILILIVSNS